MSHLFPLRNTFYFKAYGINKNLDLDDHAFISTEMDLQTTVQFEFVAGLEVLYQYHKLTWIRIHKTKNDVNNSLLGNQMIQKQRR